MQELVFSSPARLTEGQSYLVRATATNQSTRGGQPCEATLRVVVFAIVGGVLLLDVFWVETFSPAGVKSFDSKLNIPWGYGGRTGEIFATVQDPNGNVLIQISEPLTVEAGAPPRGSLTVKSWNVPVSSPPGTVSCSVTYEVTGYIEWGSFYIGYGDQPGQLVGPAPVSEGTHTIPFSFSMPSDGYQYMRCYAVIEYGVWYEWSASVPGYFNIYLTL